MWHLMTPDDMTPFDADELFNIIVFHENVLYLAGIRIGLKRQNIIDFWRPYWQADLDLS